MTLRSVRYKKKRVQPQKGDWTFFSFCKSMIAPAVTIVLIGNLSFGSDLVTADGVLQSIESKSVGFVEDQTPTPDQKSDLRESAPTSKRQILKILEEGQPPLIYPGQFANRSLAELKSNGDLSRQFVSLFQEVDSLHTDLLILWRRELSKVKGVCHKALGLDARLMELLPVYLERGLLDSSQFIRSELAVRNLFSMMVALDILIVESSDSNLAATGCRDANMRTQLRQIIKERNRKIQYMIVALFGQRGLKSIQDFRGELEQELSDAYEGAKETGGAILTFGTIAVAFIGPVFKKLPIIGPTLASMSFLSQLMVTTAADITASMAIDSVKQLTQASPEEKYLANLLKKQTPQEFEAAFSAVIDVGHDLASLWAGKPTVDDYLAIEADFSNQYQRYLHYKQAQLESIPDS